MARVKKSLNSAKGGKSAKQVVAERIKKKQRRAKQLEGAEGEKKRRRHHPGVVAKRMVKTMKKRIKPILPLEPIRRHCYELLSTLAGESGKNNPDRISKEAVGLLRLYLQQRTVRTWHALSILARHDDRQGVSEKDVMALYHVRSVEGTLNPATFNRLFERNRLATLYPNTLTDGERKKEARFKQLAVEVKQQENRQKMASHQPPRRPAHGGKKPAQRVLDQIVREKEVGYVVRPGDDDGDDVPLGAATAHSNGDPAAAQALVSLTQS